MMTNLLDQPATWRAWVGLGANLGHPQQTLMSALEALAQLPQTCLRQTSAPYLTRPLDAEGPDYWNAVAELHTALPAKALLTAMQDIELQHGRQRPYRNAPRTLDLDLLWHEEGPVDDPKLTLPHPRMTQRAFVLAPWCELTPDLALPCGGTPSTWLTRLPDQGVIRQPNPPGWPQ